MTTQHPAGSTAALDWLRRFNRRVTNPITLTFAGKWLYAIVHHVGRRSGRHYATPVVAVPAGDQFFMPLPYGADADWCRNVLAAGGSWLTWRGDTYAVGEPELIDPAEALPAFPRWLHRMLRHVKVYLRVTRESPAQ